MFSTHVHDDDGDDDYDDDDGDGDGDHDDDGDDDDDDCCCLIMPKLLLLDPPGTSAVLSVRLAGPGRAIPRGVEQFFLFQNHHR